MTGREQRTEADSTRVLLVRCLDFSIITVRMKKFRNGETQAGASKDSVYQQARHRWDSKLWE